MLSHWSRSRSRSVSCPRPARAWSGSAPATRCPRGTACTCRRTRACRTRSSAAPPGPRRWSRRRAAARGCRASSRRRRPPRSPRGTSRCSSVSSGVLEPPGVQNFSSWPSRMPPARSISSRRVMPSGASYWPGRVTWPDRREDAVALGLLGAHRGEPLGAVLDDARHRRDRLDVVDDGRAGVEAGDRGERRAQAGLAAATLEALEQRGLLATDVGAGAGVHDDVEVVAGAVDVLAEVAGGVRLVDRGLHPADRRAAPRRGCR